MNQQAAGTNQRDGQAAGTGQRAGSKGASSRPGQAAGRGRGSGPARRGGGTAADPARQAAYAVLTAVTSRDAYANLLLAATLSERGLHGQDAALATELVYGTLRRRGSYDAIIGLCADRPVERIDGPLLDALRLGAHQLLGMRMKPHAAVSTAVDLATAAAGRRSAGFVNAVLRRMAAQDLRSWLDVAAPDRAADPIGYLSVSYSHPRWIVAALAEALGERPGRLDQTEAALAADTDRPVVTLSAVPGLASQEELAAAGAVRARWSPFGCYLADGDPGLIGAVSERRAAVQDEASQLAVLALTRAPAGPDRTWLDLCAGPGGKARLLAGLAAARGGCLVAADLHEHRAALTATAVSAIPAARVLTADATVPPWRPGTFDRVLADVPCSGLGSLRRRPEARWRRKPGDVAALGGLQRRLLTAAITSARPGGVIGYVTCSPLVAETREVINDVLAAHPGVQVLDAPALLPEVPGLSCPTPYERFAQFWPHRHGTDAMFVAVLRRAG